MPDITVTVARGHKKEPLAMVKSEQTW